MRVGRAHYVTEKESDRGCEMTNDDADAADWIRGLPFNSVRFLHSHIRYYRGAVGAAGIVEGEP